jgi:site-specific DNA-methyltransferase (adenine-specific)
VVTCTDADEQRLVITLNGHAGEWDETKLTLLLRDLANAAEKIDNLMIKTPALDRMLRELSEQQLHGDPDAVPPVPIDPVTKPGDVWGMGDHRLICGDSTNPDVLEALLSEGEQVSLLLTDPPYNVAYAGKTADAMTIANDDMSDTDYRNFLDEVLSNAERFLARGAAFYVWHADSEGLAVRTACDHAGLPVRQCLIWVKNSLVLGRQDYQWRHEPCLYGWIPGAAHTWLSDRSQTTVLEFDRPARNDDHPTMKPVALFAYLIGNSCPPGGVVLDPFGGSGTTLIACEQLGRHARLVELAPRYCDVIVRRWESLTGKTAVRIPVQMGA